MAIELQNAGDAVYFNPLSAASPKVAWFLSIRNISGISPPPLLGNEKYVPGTSFTIKFFSPCSTTRNCQFSDAK